MKINNNIFKIVFALIFSVNIYSNEVDIKSTESDIELDKEVDNIGVPIEENGDINIVYVGEIKKEGGNFKLASRTPASTISAPSGFTGKFGEYSLNFGVNKSPEKSARGGVSFTMGLFDPEKLGGSITLWSRSSEKNEKEFFRRGELDISLGKTFGDNGVSLGVSSIEVWRESMDKRVDPSVYLAYSRFFSETYFPVKVTLGVGNNRFNVYSKEEDPLKKVELFSAVGIYLFPELSLVLDYTARNLSGGISFVPTPLLPLTLDLGVSNIGKGKNKVEFIGSLGYTFKF